MTIVWLVKQNRRRGYPINAVGHRWAGGIRCYNQIVLSRRSGVRADVQLDGSHVVRSNQELEAKGE